MQFQLPEQLQLEVMKYDATRKKLAKETTKTVTRKAKYPKGNVASLGMIPEDVVAPKDLADAINRINQADASQAFHRFTRIDSSSTKVITHAVIYHTKQFWVAAWRPRSKDAGYYYGISVAFRDSATARKQFYGKMFQCSNTSNDALVESISDMELKTIGRTDWCFRSVRITQQLINKGYTRPYYLDVDGNHSVEAYKERTRLIRSNVKEFHKDLMETIPSWLGTRSYANDWVRTTPEGNSIYFCLSQLYNSSFNSKLLSQFEHTPDWYINTFKNSVDYKYINKQLFESKWMRKKAALVCTQTSAAFNSADPKSADVKQIYKYVGEFCQFLSTTNELMKLFPDANLDLVISRYDLLVETDFRMFASTLGEPELGVKLWLEENLSVESFLNMLAKFHERKVTEVSTRRPSHFTYVINDRTQRPSFFWRDWDDTVSMLRQVLSYNKNLPADAKQLNTMPKRWRLPEWHDMLMAETWKIRNPNQDLPQKLFPQPIKIPFNDVARADQAGTKPGPGSYCFFQPIDTHQLAQWGQAVRNCVGSANYADGVRKFKHLIVLTMMENKPRYTIQLRVDNGIMHVSQIADVANGRLSDEERAEVEDAFQLALREREAQLNS